MELLARAVALLTCVVWTGAVRTEEEVPSTHVPRILSLSEEVAVRRGDRVVFDCDVDELGGFAKVWKKNEEVYFTNDFRFVENKRISLTAKNSLEIRNITANDTGEYICQISSNQPQELRHKLIVIVPPIIKTVPKDGQVAIGIGQNFSIGCEATGLPKLTISWTHSKGTLIENVQKGNYIIVPAAEEKHAGEYKCTVTNGYDEPVVGSIQVLIHSIEDATTNELIQMGKESDATTLLSVEYAGQEATPLPDSQDDDATSCQSEIFIILTVTAWSFFFL